MIRGLVSGIFMGVLLLVFGGVMVSALLPILRPQPVSETASRGGAEAAPDAGAAQDRAAQEPGEAGPGEAGRAGAAPTGSVVDQAGARAEPATAPDRQRQIASLPAVQGAGTPPAMASDATRTRPEVPAGAPGGRRVPDPLSERAPAASGAGQTATRGAESGAVPGTREAARPQAPLREAAPSVATAPASGAGAQEPPSVVQPPAAAGPVAGSGIGLKAPRPDAAPAAQDGTTPPARPETGAAVTAVTTPKADTAPGAPGGVVDAPSVQTALVPPSGARSAPLPDAAPPAPGLPGRTLQSTPVRPGAAPEIGPETGDIAPRFGLSETTPVPEPGLAAPLRVPGRGAALPDVGAPAEPRASAGGAGTPRDPGESQAATASAPETPARTALPRVRRPGAENGQASGQNSSGQNSGQNSGQDNTAPGAGRIAPGGPAFDGPAAPAAPVVEDRALPTPGFSGLRSGVRTGRLPQIGGRDGAADASAAPQAPAETSPQADAGSARIYDPDSPFVYNAAPFANPDGRPLVAVILIDDLADRSGPNRLAALDLPVTVAIDPLAPDAAQVADRYRAAGKEVLILASGLPPGARAVDVEVSLQGMFAAVPAAVGLIDTAEGGFQNERITARHVVEVLGAEGYGLLTHDRGLNAAAQLGEQAGLAVGRVFRVLDAENEGEDEIRRYLDRAAFRAGQQGAAMVMGHNRPETVAALIGWAMEGRARTVALAPVTAALTRR